MIAPAWRAVLLLAGAAALNYADRTSLSAVFPLLQAELHLSDLQLAGIGTLFLWSYAAGSAGAGFLADRLPRHRVVAWSLLAWSLVTIVTGLARTADQLLATRVVLGLAECLYLPAAVALIADHHPAASRGRALALHLCGLNAGLVGGGALAGYLGEEYGWRIGLFFLGGVGIVLSGVCLLALPASPRSEAPAPPAPVGPQLRGLLRRRGYLLLAMQGMLISVSTWMFFNWMPLYFRESFGLSLALAGFSGTAVLQLSAVGGALVGGTLSDRAARRAADGRLRMMTVCYLLCAPCLLIFLSGGGMAVISVAVVLFSFLRAVATANETPAMCEFVDPRDRSTAQSLMNMLNTMAGGTGVFVAGYLKADWGLNGVFAGVAVLVFAAAGLAWLARPAKA
ncbi:MAG: MFS transporter [Acidobacteriota bacterium]|jgi:predicted MFS family arabinose efflux permease|nr:MFS transporter [Acidobacteriaceae bacterium]